MASIETLPIVRVGNSWGIRLPKRLIDQCRVEDRVEVQIRGRRIVLIPIDGKPRTGWEATAKAMSECGDDELLVPEFLDDEAINHSRLSMAC